MWLWKGSVGVWNHEPRLISPVIFRNQPDEDVQRMMHGGSAMISILSSQVRSGSLACQVAMAKWNFNAAQQGRDEAGKELPRIDYVPVREGTPGENVVLDKTFIKLFIVIHPGKYADIGL